MLCRGSLCGQVGRLDGVDRIHPHRPPHRDGARQERHHQPDHRHPGEHGGLERGVPHRQGDEPGEDRPHGAADENADADPEHYAEEGDLGADQERPDRQQPGPHAQCHPDADLSTLLLGQAMDQIEGRADCSGEQQQGERIEHGLVLIDVRGQRGVGEVVVAVRHRGAYP